MSFAAIRNIAVSSLTATTVQTTVTSANIANADVDGYTRKTATQTTVVTGGAGSGTQVTGITSKVDKYLVQALTKSLSQQGAAEATSTYMDRLQSLFGSTVGSNDSGTSLANTIADLATALSNLAVTPESESLQVSVVDAFDAVAAQLRETSSGIQDLRSDADGAISDAVNDVNAALQQIDSLNDQIIAAKARGDSTADLEDKRTTALQAVAEKMNVSAFANSNGTLYVYTSSGQPLVDSTAHTISYESVGTVSAGTVFNAITVNGTDITSSIGGGEIGALITVRDKTLPAAQAELDNLAASLIDATNAVYNQGSSIPAPATLTGSESFAPTDALSATGTVRIALTKDDGTLVSYQDIDLSSCATIGDLVTALDGIDGVSASLDASGHLVLTADDSDIGIAVGTSTSSIGASGQGFSDYFGLNDLLVGTGAGDIAVRSDLAATPGLFGAATLSDDATMTAGTKVLTGGDASIASALQDMLSASRKFTSAGQLGATSTSFTNYASDIVSNVAASAKTAAATYSKIEAATSALQNSLASQSGVNLDEETARLSELQNLYSVSAEILTTLNAMFDALLNAAR